MEKDRNPEKQVLFFFFYICNTDSINYFFYLIYICGIFIKYMFWTQYAMFFFNQINFRLTTKWMTRHFKMWICACGIIKKVILFDYF